MNPRLLTEFFPSRRQERRKHCGFAVAHPPCSAAPTGRPPRRAAALAPTLRDTVRERERERERLRLRLRLPGSQRAELPRLNAIFFLEAEQSKAPPWPLLSGGSGVSATSEGEQGFPGGIANGGSLDGMEEGMWGVPAEHGERYQS